MNEVQQRTLAGTALKKERGKGYMAVILRDVPKGFSWGWFSREDPRMHIQTVDKKNLNLYKVWLEKNGKRVFEPAKPIPAKIIKKLEEEVTTKRSHVEGRWTNMMIKYNWLTYSVKGSIIILTGYPAFPGSKFTRTVDLADYFQGIYDPSTRITPKERVKPEEVVLNDEMAAIEIWPQKDESSREHIFLPPILWQDR